MLRKILLFTTLLFVSASCSNTEEPAIIKQESTSSGTQPELIEEEQEDEKIEFIEFPLDNEQITINLQAVPILKGYLAAAEQPNEKIEEMELMLIHPEKNIYLLEFSCVNQQCSYLLLNPSEDNKAFLLADLAMYEGIESSPDGNRIVFRFARDHTSGLPVADLIAIDIPKWTKLSITDTEGNKELSGYNQPIQEVEWVNNEQLRADFPSLKQQPPADQSSVDTSGSEQQQETQTRIFQVTMK
ncbi:hypothetical protein [Virgibacillus sediminis]|uniref:DUF5068 domain-containing protein n=1 Tax=Virgibacillus sediminis TaxID=202260 RepID=A0ABV7AC61_9BACI